MIRRVKTTDVAANTREVTSFLVWTRKKNRKKKKIQKNRKKENSKK